MTIGLQIEYQKIPDTRGERDRNSTKGEIPRRPKKRKKKKKHHQRTLWFNQFPIDRVSGEKLVETFKDGRRDVFFCGHVRISE